MAFPWIFGIEGFESGGTIATATSGSLITFPHYTELARQGMAPYRGAYCLKVKLAGGTTSQYIREDTAFDDLTASTTRYVRWYFYLGKDLVMGATDSVSMFEAESVLDTTTVVSAGIRRATTNIEFWWGLAQATASPGTIVLGTTTTALGKWYCAEIKIVLDSGVGNDGTITGYINNIAGAAKASLDQGVIVNAKFGAIGPDAGTSGTILIDDIIYDDTQIYTDTERFRGLNAHIVQATDHPIVGAAKFSIKLTGTGTNAVLTMYDTDGVPAGKLEPIDVIRNVTANESVPGYDVYEVSRGLYTVLSGTAAQAFISIERGGIISDAGYVNLGRAQKAPRQ